jgi:hypothetical protein
VLLGAEFTRFYVERFRGKPPPVKYAEPEPAPAQLSATQHG